jgi:hypothetical protein
MWKTPLLMLCLLGPALVAPISADETQPAAAQAKPAAPHSNCTRDTGSRLRRNTDGCAGVGKSYSKDDVWRTGEPNASGALRQLDPSVTISH